MKINFICLGLVVLLATGCSGEKKAVENPMKVSIETSEGLFKKSMLLLAQNKVPEAIKTLVQASELSPKDTNIYFALAQVYMNIRAYDKSLAVCQEILKIDGKSPDTFLLMAACYDLKGEPEKAAELVKMSMVLFQEQENIEGFQKASSILTQLSS